ncbi:MAG: hypothetical protein IPP06_06220 [Saprospiraceae bacterium]|nr:hypothetical protein [Candidatus Vicinibacter affinis]
MGNQDIGFTRESGVGEMIGADKSSSSEGNEIVRRQTNDPFLGQYKGQLFGMDCILIIKKLSENKYAIYVNGLGPDEAILENGILSGNSSGIPFRLRISNEKLVLNMFEQDLIFERDSNAGIQPLNNDLKNSETYSDHNSEISKEEFIVDNNSQDPFVGNYDIMNKDKFIMEVSIRNSSGNQYIGNSSKNEFYLMKKNPFELIGEGCSIRISGSDLLYIENGQVFLLNNKRPFKLISKEILIIDDRLLGKWKGTLSSYYGGHSTVTEYLIVFKNDGSYIEVKDFTSGGYTGSVSLLDDAEKGYYQIIEKTKEGGKINIFGKRLGYSLLDKNNKLFLYGVTYYRQ